MGRAKKSKRRRGKPQDRDTLAAGSPSVRRHVAWALALAAALLGGLVYANALENPFVYDDLRTVVRNPTIQHPENVLALLLHERFRPLVNVTYAFDYALWGLKPRGYHGTSIVLHMLAVALFFAAARALFADRRRLSPPEGPPDGPPEGPPGVLPPPAAPAFAAAALFAVHPMMTEAVGYVSGRSEVLCTIFFLAAFLFLRGFLLGGGAARLAAGLAAFVCALASKEVGAMLPFVLVGWDVLFAGPAGRRRRFLRFHLPLLLLVGVGAVVRLWTFLGVESSTLPRPVWQNVLSQWEIVWRYLGLLFLPVSQSVVHPTQRVSTAADLSALAAGLALCALVAATVHLRRRGPLLSFGVLWLLLLLAPSSSLLPLNELMAEHRVYGASCGFFLAVVAAADPRLGTRPARRAAAAALAAVLLALAGATWARNRVWSDPVTLWGDAAEKAPLTWRALWGLGDALRSRGDCAAAIEPFRRAVAAQSEDPGTRMDLGVCLAQTRRYDEARQVFLEAVEVDPRFAKGFNNLGLLASITGQSAAAVKHFRRAIEEDPQNVEARLNLVDLYQKKRGDPGEILSLCREVQEIAPTTPGIGECIERYGG